MPPAGQISGYPRDWYWRVDGRVYSSARRAYVEDSDATFQVWLSRHPGGLMSVTMDQVPAGVRP